MTRDDRGFVTVWIVALMGAFVAVIGLVLDGGRIIRERSYAYGAAAAAARAGAQELDDPAAVGGVIRLDEDAAEDTARAYLDDIDLPWAPGGVDVEVDGTQVVVRIAGATDLQLFPGEMPFEVEATVELQRRGNP